MKNIALILSFCSVLFPLSAFAEPLKSQNPWAALEQGILALHKTYDPKHALLNDQAFVQQVEQQINAGLWSSAQSLLEGSDFISVKRLRQTLLVRRGEFEAVYKTAQADPDLFLGQAEITLGAAQGALINKDFQGAIALLKSRILQEEGIPLRLYLTALAYWGLKDDDNLKVVLSAAQSWAEDYEDSPWAARFHLLKVYYHLSRQEHDQAFASLGPVFNENADMALLALTWGYFQLDATEDLLGTLYAIESDAPDSPYYSQVFRILSRFLIEKGDLRGAIEMDQQEWEALRKQRQALEEEMNTLKASETAFGRSFPPASLLTQTLQDLQERVGEKHEISTLLWAINLRQNREVLKKLKKRERHIEREQRRLQMGMIRRCISLRQGKLNDPALEQIYKEAQNAAEAKQVSTVVAKLRELLGHQPKGSYAEESHFRLGNFAFNSENYDTAIQHYSSLLKQPESPLYRASVYKLSWAYYLEGKADLAIQLLINQQIDQQIAERQKAGIDGKKTAESLCEISRTTVEETAPFRLMALTLNALGGAEQVVALVKDRAIADAYTLVEKTAHYYESEKRLAEMFVVINAWINANPLYKQTPFLHQKMLARIKKSDQNTTAAIIAARTDFIRRYEPGSDWAIANQAGQAERVNKESARPESVAMILKKHLQFLMAHFYAEGKKTDALEVNAKGLPWYRRYLEQFPKEAGSGRIRFLYANLLSKNGDEIAASIAYQQSAYEDVPHQLSVEAGFREIILLEKRFEASHPNILAGYDRFVSRFPSDARAKEISMRLASFFFEQDNYRKSRIYAAAVLPKPDRIQAAFRGIEVSASRMIAQSYLKERAYAEAITFLESLFFRVSKQEGMAEFTALLVLAYFQNGEALKQRAKHQPAADSYWEAYIRGTEDEIGPLALFEAATLWRRAGSGERSEEALQIFYNRYPNSVLYHPALMSLAARYQETGRLAHAADTYEEASELATQDRLSRKALEEAIGLYEQLGDWRKVFTLVIKRAAHPPEEGQDATFWMLKAAEAKLNVKEAVLAQQILVALIKNAPEDEAESDPVTKAHLLLAESKIADFEAVALKMPLDINLQKKNALFEDLLAAYSKALLHSSPKVTLNANHRIGQIFESFSRALLLSERPQDLTYEEALLYEDLLNEQALPYIEGAEAAYLENIEYGLSLGVKNEWTQKSAERLKQIYKTFELATLEEEET